jgi:hypothetical protein
MPQNMKSAKICITWSSQGEAVEPLGAPRARKGPITTCATMAPSFPAAADNPCDVDR